MLITTITMLGPINSIAYFPWLVILGVVIHAHVRLVESLKAKARGENGGGNHFNVAIQNQQGQKSL
jgi:hypothetical protein